MEAAELVLIMDDGYYRELAVIAIDLAIQKVEDASASRDGTWNDFHEILGSYMDGMNPDLQVSMV